MITVTYCISPHYYPHSNIMFLLCEKIILFLVYLKRMSKCFVKLKQKTTTSTKMEWGGRSRTWCSFQNMICIVYGDTIPKNSPPKAVLCNLGNSERETQMSCVQRWKQTTMTVPFLNSERTRECEREGKDETMSNFLASSGQIWPRSHQPLSCLRRCWQSAKCVWRWLRLVHIQQLARRDTQKKGW